MNGTFERILTDTEIGKVIFSYIHKNLRNGDSFIIYKDQDSSIKTIKEKNITKLPESTIGVIDQGIFLPLYKL